MVYIISQFYFSCKKEEIKFETFADLLDQIYIHRVYKKVTNKYLQFIMFKLELLRVKSQINCTILFLKMYHYAEIELVKVHFFKMD